MCISLVVIFGLGAVVLAISPLLDSAAQVPFVAGVIRSAEGIASVLQACLYAVRMILQASATEEKRNKNERESLKLFILAACPG